MARPQPSLRFADGGSFITRWAEKAHPQNPPNQGGEGGGLGKDAVMAAIARQQREAAAPPPAPPSAPKVDFLRNPGGALKGRMQAAGLELQDGGHVPGSGEGDKIPAKYEPGEFVVSNDMIDDNPGLREGLASMRAETLAVRGKTEAEADAKATRHMGSLRAADGWDPLDRMAKDLTGQNTLAPRSPVGNMAQDLVQNARPPFDPNRNFAAPNNGLPPGPSSSTIHGAPAPVNAPTNGLPPGPASEYPRSIKAPTGGLPPGPSSSLAGGPAAAAAEALHGERVNPTLRPNNAAFHGDGRYGAPAGGPSNAATSALGEANAATRAASGVPGAPSAAGKWFGSADDWKGMVGSQKGSLKMSPAAAPGMLGKGLLGVQGAVGAYNAYEGIQEGDALKTGLGAADVAATGALLTPAAPAAAAYLGVRGAWEGGKAAGDYIGSKFSDKTRDAIGGTINQIGLNTGLWGTDDSAYLQQKAANPVAPSQQPAAQPSAPSARAPQAQTPAQGRSPVGDTIITDGGVGPGNVTRNGNSYSGGNVSGPITINGMEPGFGMNMGSGPNAQNEAAANNLAARETLRGQQAAGGGQPQRPQVQQTLHSGNDWASRNALRNLEVSASSIQSSQSPWGNKDKGKADIANFQNAQAMDQAKQAGADQGSVSRTQAGASMYGADQSAATSRYTSDNSLRGARAQADAVGGATRATAQAKAQQQAMYGQIFRVANGDPVAAAQMAASYGLDPQQFTGMASAAQTRGAANDKSTRAVFGGMFGKDGEQQESQAHHMAQQMFPDWNRMGPEDQAKASTEVVQATKALQSMNAQRNSGWSKKLGFDAPSPEMSQLPDMTGATVGSVGAMQGWTTPGVSRGDTKVTLRNGTERYLKPEEMTEQQLRIFQNRGAKPAKD